MVHSPCAATPVRGPDVASAEFRRVLLHLPTGVTVVSALHEALPIGMTVGTFASLSLDPALVLFSAARSSTTWPLIERSGRFCANVLRAEATHLSEQFARRGPRRFDAVPWRPAESGAPILLDAVAWIDCSVRDVLDGGDHLIIVGQVQDLGVGDQAAPLVFFRGGYLNVTGDAPARGERCA